MSVDGYAWWPVASGPGAITRDNLKNLNTYAALSNAGGPAYLPTPKDDWPFEGSSSSGFKLISLDWSSASDFSTKELNKATYVEYLQNNDQRLLSKLRMWSFFANSVDSSSEGYNAYNGIATNAPNLVGAVSSLPQNQGIAMVFDNPISLSGLLLDHIIELSNLSFPYNGKGISSGDILQAYTDAWENAYQYWRIESQNKPDIWWHKGAVPQLFKPFVVIVHAVNPIIDQIKGLNSPMDALSPKSGFQKTNSGITWNMAVAKGATGDDYWNMNFNDNSTEWFKLGISQGDNFPNQTGAISTRSWHQSTRRWAPESASGQYVQGYAGTISNGNLSSQIPLIDCIAIVPLFAAYPEVYQCLTRNGPVFDTVSSTKTSLNDQGVYDYTVTTEQRKRYGKRDLVFNYPFEYVTINRMFLQTVVSGRKMALPGAGLPASGLQYLINVNGTVPISAFTMTGAGSMWPGGDISSTYPTHHVKLYNVLDRGDGFAHSFALRQAFVATDWGMGIMAGAGSGSLIGTLEGMAIGEIFSPKQVFWMGLMPSFKSINNALLVWNPKTTAAENSSAIQVSEVAVGPNRESLIDDVGVPNSKGKPITEITSNKDESLATWSIWPESFSNAGGLDGDKYLTRGLFKLRFRAKTNVPKSVASVFIEFRFYAVDVSETGSIKNSQDLLNSIKGSRKDVGLIDNSVIGQQEFLLRLYNEGGLDTQGPGRQFVWKPITSGFDQIRAASNDIFSPSLDTDYQDFVMNLYLDDFFIPSGANTKLASKIEVNNKMGMGDKVFNASNTFFFVNARVRSVAKTQGDVPSISLDLSAMDISMPAKTIEGNYIGLEQRFYNSFNPTTGGGNKTLDDLKMFIPASLADTLITSTNKIYDFQWKGYPELTKMIQLSPFSGSANINKIGLHAMGISANRLASISDQDLIKILKSYTGVYFMTSPYIMDYTLMAGDPNIYWYLDLDISQIVQEQTGTVADGANQVVIYYSLIFVDESNNTVTMKEEGLTRGRSNDLKIGPMVSDITFLSSGYLLLKIVLAVNAPGLSDNPAIVYINPQNSKIKHGGSIKKVKMTGPQGDVLGGKHIAWYRGLTMGRFHSAQDMIYVMDKMTESGWTLPGGDYKFSAVVRSPTILARMARPYGWVLEYEGPGLVNPLVAMIKDSGGVDSQKLSVSMATNDGHALDLMSPDNTTKNISMFKLNSHSALLDTINLTINGQVIQGNETAIAQSSRAASNHDASQTSGGALVGVGSDDSNGSYIRMFSYVSGLYPSEENI